MDILCKYINTASKEKVTDRVNIYTNQCDKVSVVYVQALSGGFDAFDKDMSIDSDGGVCIDITSPDCLRYMANYRSIQWWCDPHFSEKLGDMPKDTQFLIIQRQDGLFEVFVPIVSERYKCVFEGKNNDIFTARIFSQYKQLYECECPAFAYAIGENPLELTEKCVETALNEINSRTRMRKNRRYPELFDYLGWCSWDAMQIRVNENGMIEKCDEFSNKNVPVRWVILDDMWATVKPFTKFSYGEDHMDMVNLMYASALYSFEADPERFPTGLKGLIDKIKDRGLKIGIWHPTTGYWRGIDENGDAYKELSEYLIKSENGYYVPDWRQEKSYMYYNTIHDFFVKCGADFVKIDNQSMIDRLYKGQAPIAQIAKELHAGMEASVGEHFDGTMINCMGMASEDIWSRSISPISRCSNDFQPESKEWFSKHILQCAYNSILQGQFYWCDWDMWWTDDGQSLKNSLMRAVSGGPIYVSDKINRTIPEILEPLTLSDGRILRCDKPAMPAVDCVACDCRKNKKAFKLQNTAGEYGVLAVLNIDENDDSVSANISLRDINGLKNGKYAVYEHFSQELIILDNDKDSFDITLSNSDEYKLYIFAPIKNGFAAIGRIDKFISPKTIKYIHNGDIVLEESGPYAYVKNNELIIEGYESNRNGY